MCCNCSSSLFTGALSIGSLLLATVFHIVAFSSNYWLTGSSNDKTRNITNYEFGLWTTCYNEVLISSPTGQSVNQAAVNAQQTTDDNVTIITSLTSTLNPAVTSPIATAPTSRPVSSAVYICDSTHTWIYSQNNGGLITEAISYQSNWKEFLCSWQAKSLG